MTNPIERVWVALDRSGHPQFAAPWSEDVHEHINDAINCDIPGAAQWVVREYRLHRPIPWRTGVPDAETVKKGTKFALLLRNGSLLRGAQRNHQHWHWNASVRFNGAWLANRDIIGWCPEDEMPKEAT